MEAYPRGGGDQPFSWQDTVEVLKQSHRIRAEAREIREQAQAEMERARKLIQTPLPSKPKIHSDGSS